MGDIIVAIPVLAVEQLGDVALGGLLAAAALGPSIVAAPIVGAAPTAPDAPARSSPAPAW